MRSACYITTFNDPESCMRLLPDLDQRITDGYVKIISDQSDSVEMRERYQEIAKSSGWEYIHHENGGAQKAKHDIIRHAVENKFAFMAQISEDFVINHGYTGPVPAGCDCFFEVAHGLLMARPNLTFVNWSMLRPSFIGWAAGYHIAMNDPLWRIRYIRSEQRLLYVEGDICMFNWPYTARVSSLAACLQQADIIGKNSEVNLAISTMGLGASLLAFPVKHTDRPRHPRSIR